ncbi:MAG TPA: LexA family transcriptional regulator [Nitrospira sp.]|nr:LexA family transcriptional regulator [Nitrospira sp.]
MNLKSLVHREICEGMTEEQVASSVGVSLRTIKSILTGKDPKIRSIWENFARYFRMDVEFLRTGESRYVKRGGELSTGPSQSAAGHIRNIPLLNWHQLAPLAKLGDFPGPIHGEAVVEATDISGTRTFALKVQDESMEPLFSKGEMIFINPDLAWRPGDFVITTRYDNSIASTLLRQIKVIGNQCILHPVNRKYEDLPLTEPDFVWGKVVRLRKNL